MSLFADVGQICGNAGIPELFCESDVYTKATASQSSASKDRVRVMKTYLLVDETLQGSFMDNFLQGMKHSNTDKFVDLQTKVKYQVGCFTITSEEQTEVFIFIDSKVLPLIEQF